MRISNLTMAMVLIGAVSYEPIDSVYLHPNLFLSLENLEPELSDLMPVIKPNTYNLECRFCFFDELPVEEKWRVYEETMQKIRDFENKEERERLIRIILAEPLYRQELAKPRVPKPIPYQPNDNWRGIGNRKMKKV